MLENIKLSEKQIKSAALFFSKIPVITRTYDFGNIDGNMILSADASGLTFIFFSDDTTPYDYYYQFSIEIDIFDRDSLLSAINKTYGERLIFS